MGVHPLTTSTKGRGYAQCRRQKQRVLKANPVSKPTHGGPLPSVMGMLAENFSQAADDYSGGSDCSGDNIKVRTLSHSTDSRVESTGQPNLTNDSVGVRKGIGAGNANADNRHVQSSLSR